MSNNIKVSDVFNLPLICEAGDGYIYSNDLRHEIRFDDTDLNCMKQKQLVSHAINNHDRLVEENAKLREALQECVEALDGSYDVTEWPANGQSRCDIASSKAKLLLIGD